MQLFLLQTHVQCTHRFQSANAAAITQREFGDFAFLPKMTVHAMFLDRDFEHLACGGAIDVAVIGEDVQSPLFPGNEGKHAGFDCGKVCHDELPAGRRYERRPDELRKCIRYVVVEYLHHFIIALPDEFTRILQIRKMVLGQVLQLNMTPSPSSRARCPVEKEHSACATVGTDAVVHRLIFLHTALRQLQPERQHALQFRRRVFDHSGDGFLAQCIRRQSAFPEPFLQLCRAVRILKIRQLSHCFHQLLLGTGIHFYRVVDEQLVDGDAAIIDFFAQMIFVPYEVRNRMLLQTFFDRLFHFHITRIVFDKQRPFFRIVIRHVSHSAAIGNCRFAGRAEVFHQFLSLGQFLVIQLQNGAHVFQ